MAKYKKTNWKKACKDLDKQTETLLAWVEEQERNYLERRTVTTVITKHGNVLVQVR